MAAEIEVTPRVMGGDQRLGVILSTAEKMFFEKGYRGVSIRDLAAAVGIQMSSLYYYFPSKDDILYRIIIRHIEGLVEVAEKAVASLDGGSDAQKLQKLIRASVLYIIQDRLAAGISTSQGRELPREQVDEINQAIRGYEGLYERLIQDGTASGEFIETDAALAAYIILGAQVRLSAWYRPEGRLTAEEVADTYSFLLMRSLVTAPGLEG